MRRLPVLLVFGCMILLCAMEVVAQTAHVHEFIGKPTEPPEISVTWKWEDQDVTLGGGGYVSISGTVRANVTDGLWYAIGGTTSTSGDTHGTVLDRTITPASTHLDYVESCEDLRAPAFGDYKVDTKLHVHTDSNTDMYYFHDFYIPHDHCFFYQNECVADLTIGSSERDGDILEITFSNILCVNDIKSIRVIASDSTTKGRWHFQYWDFDDGEWVNRDNPDCLDDLIDYDVVAGSKKQTILHPIATGTYHATTGEVRYRLACIDTEQGYCICSSTPWSSVYITP